MREPILAGASRRAGEVIETFADVYILGTVLLGRSNLIHTDTVLRKHYLFEIMSGSVIGEVKNAG